MTIIAERFSRTEVNLNGILRSGGAGLLAGIASGAVARVSMRIVALAGGQRPSFSIPGTLFILLVFGVIFGIPLGWCYAALASGNERRPWVKPLTISLGTFLFLILLAVLIGADSEELGIVPGAIAIAAFLPVPLFHSFLYGAIKGRLEAGEVLVMPRNVNLPSFLLLTAALAWAFYALSRLAESGRTLPPPVFRALLGLGLGPSAILNSLELAVFLLGIALISLPVVSYWRKYRSSRSRGTVVLTLGVLGAAFWLISLIA